MAQCIKTLSLGVRCPKEAVTGGVYCEEHHAELQALRERLGLGGAGGGGKGPRQ
jgi:hypothetical protein